MHSEDAQCPQGTWARSWHDLVAAAQAHPAVRDAMVADRPGTLRTLDAIRHCTDLLPALADRSCDWITAVVAADCGIAATLDDLLENHMTAVVGVLSRHLTHTQAVRWIASRRAPDEPAVDAGQWHVVRELATVPRWMAAAVLGEVERYREGETTHLVLAQTLQWVFFAARLTG